MRTFLARLRDKSRSTTAKTTTGKATARSGTAAKKTAAKKTAAKKTTAGKKTTTTGKKAAGGKTATGRTAGGKAGAKKTPAGKPAAGKPAAGERKPEAHEDREERAAGASRTRTRPPLLVRLLVMVLALAGMVAFAVVLSRLTLESSAASESLTHTNLRPGDSIRDYTAQPAVRDTLRQLGGNVLLGVPFGVLLPVLVPRVRGLVRVTLATALVMLLVELVQGALITGRAFDIDDVILNSSGALLGYLLLGRWLGRAVHPPRHHWWHRWTRPRQSRRSRRPEAG